jgi:60 kDa SS-A/Ro ribonucleoprotein
MKMNKNLFTSGKIHTVNSRPVVVNEAGGNAIELTPEEAVAQICITGCFRNTFYNKAEQQLDELKSRLPLVSVDFLEKLACYTWEKGLMKDTSAFLAAYLAKHRSPNHGKVMEKIICNMKQLRNFTQIIRSGQIQGKSFGQGIKKKLQKIVSAWSPDYIFLNDIGEPSFKDILCLLHLKPETEEMASVFKYIMDKSVSEKLPAVITQFDSAKKTKEITDLVLEKVNFQMLTQFSLTPAQWGKLAMNASYYTLKANLNNFAKHGAFTNPEVVASVKAKLTNETIIEKARLMPHQIYAALNYTEGEAKKLFLKELSSAFYTACKNVPTINEPTIIFVDVSGSMSNPVTGSSSGGETKITCSEAASIFAYALHKKNPNTVGVMCFDTQITNYTFKDDILATIGNIPRGGGTTISCTIQALNSMKSQHKNVIILSDNESWAETASPTTRTMEEWIMHKQRVPGAHLISVDMQPYATVQAYDPYVHHIGGFSDNVFTLIDQILSHREGNLVDTIKNYVL